MSKAWADQPVGQFLDQLAARTPVPGGGAAAAASGSLACAMARMVAAYSVRKDTADDNRRALDEIADRLLGADKLLRVLVDRDGQAYEAMVAAAKAARSEPTEGSRARHQHEVWNATAVPMQVAALAARALATMEELAPLASRHLISDLGVAAALAEAAVRAARFNVLVNAPELADEQRRFDIENEIAEITRHAGEGAKRVSAAVEMLLPSGG